jgi:hypothetical protein
MSELGPRASRGNSEKAMSEKAMSEKVMNEKVIRRLLEAIDRHLASLSGPGVVDVRAGMARWEAGAVKSLPCRLSPDLDAAAKVALAQLAAEGRPDLAEAIGATLGALSWRCYDRYPVASIGEAFASGHAFATILGEHGAIATEDFALGLFIIMPGVFYRDHRHAAPELYVPLSGPHGWRFAPGDRLSWKPAHVPVWNEPFQSHAIKVGALPFLCIFGWTRDVRQSASVIPSDDWSRFEGAAVQP